MLVRMLWRIWDKIMTSSPKIFHCTTLIGKLYWCVIDNITVANIAKNTLWQSNESSCLNIFIMVLFVNLFLARIESPYSLLACLESAWMRMQKICGNVLLFYDNQAVNQLICWSVTPFPMPRYECQTLWHHLWAV